VIKKRFVGGPERAALLLAAAVVVATAAPAFAHHSFAMYDHTRTASAKMGK
jgi:hypothetical protein